MANRTCKLNSSKEAPEDASFTNSIYAVCFTPDGSTILVTIGDRILFYKTENMEYDNYIKGHKDIVTCLSYSKDSQRFASGSHDKTVVIWGANREGLLRYSHKAKIMALSFNPVLNSLASISEQDFGIWSIDQPNVVKHDLSE